MPSPSQLDPQPGYFQKLPAPHLLAGASMVLVRLSDARDALVASMDHLGDVDDAIYTEAERV